MPRSPRSSGCIRSLGRVVWLALLAGVLVAPAAPAGALSITGLGIVKNPTNSASRLTQNASSMRTRDSSVSVVSSTATSFTTRYAMVVGADVANAPSVTENMTANFSITFQVNATLGQAWVVSLAVARVGALTLVSDGATGSARATLGAVTATRTGAGSLSGSLALAAVPTITSGATTDSPFNQVASATLSGVGTGAPQSITWRFRFNASARSTRASGNGDEAAVRMGLTSAATNFTADDYPGIGGRTMLDDGFFLSATLVPEPGTHVLLVSGLIGLALFGRRPRDRSAFHREA